MPPRERTRSVAPLSSLAPTTEAAIPVVSAVLPAFRVEQIGLLTSRARELAAEHRRNAQAIAELASRNDSIEADLKEIVRQVESHAWDENLPILR